MSASPVPATLADALRQAKAAGVDRLDAQQLLGHLAGQSRTWVIAHEHDPWPPALTAPWTDLLARRAADEPLAYLLGAKEFHGLTLQVGPDVLVPRPDTETLVDWALERLRHLPADARVIDLGTGSGAIALAVRHACPQTEVWAVDASPGALATAQANAERLGLPVRFLLGDWWEPVGDARFHLVLSNPPYIAEGDPHLPALRHEPRQALTSGPQGLDALRHLTCHSPSHLQAGGWLLLEHGYDQGDVVRELLVQQGFTQVETRIDSADVPRCTGGMWPG